VYLGGIEKLYAVGYRGLAGRASFNWRFRTAANRAQYVAEFIEKCREAEAFKATQKHAVAEARAQFVNPYQIGDILETVWGYEQTNVDFFQIVEVLPMSIRVRPICGETVESTGPFSARVVALKNRFADEALPKLVRLMIDKSGKPYCSIEGHNLYVWDGKPSHCSWGY
jgi:hypothetical protein